MPPGTANIVPPETLERVGGPEKFAQPADVAASELGMLLREPERITALQFDNG